MAKGKSEKGKIINKQTLKQQRFIDNYLESGNATDAVIKAGYKTKNNGTARAIGSQNLTKINIKASIEERVKKAKDMIYKLSQGSKKEEVRIKACQDIIDRAEGKALARTEHSGKLEIVSETELLD